VGNLPVPGILLQKTKNLSNRVPHPCHACHDHAHVQTAHGHCPKNRHHSRQMRGLRPMNPIPSARHIHLAQDQLDPRSPCRSHLGQYDAAMAGAEAELAAAPMVPSLGLGVAPRALEVHPRDLEVEGLDAGPQELATARFVLGSTVVLVPNVWD
jgi:hypothetical protein